MTFHNAVYFCTPDDRGAESEHVAADAGVLQRPRGVRPRALGARRGAGGGHQGRAPVPPHPVRTRTQDVRRWVQSNVHAGGMKPDMGACRFRWGPEMVKKVCSEMAQQHRLPNHEQWFIFTGQKAFCSLAQVVGSRSRRCTSSSPSCSPASASRGCPPNPCASATTCSSRPTPTPTSASRPCEAIHQIQM